LVALIGLAGIAPASAQQIRTPDHCRTGAYITDLYNLSQPDRTFKADVWFWSVCDKPTRRPLQSMEYVNASQFNITLDSTAPRGDQFWSNRKVVGTWRHVWNVANYPFDRQTLTMVVEEGLQDVRSFYYDADGENSSYDPSLDIPGWRITDSRIVPNAHQYPTTFGDPSLTINTSAEYSRLSIEVDIQRDGFLSFLKLTAVVYVAAALALMSFRLNPIRHFGDRMGLLAGALFATVISMNSANSELASADQLTLIDLIHIACLILILSAAMLTLINNRAGTTDRDVLRRRDYISLVSAAGAFVGINLALIGTALLAG
jgi:hypothetical protein